MPITHQVPPPLFHRMGYSLKKGKRTQSLKKLLLLGSTVCSTLALDASLANERLRPVLGYVSEGGVSYDDKHHMSASTAGGVPNSIDG